MVRMVGLPMGVQNLQSNISGNRCQHGLLACRRLWGSPSGTPHGRLCALLLSFDGGARSAAIPSDASLQSMSARLARLQAVLGITFRVPHTDDYVPFYYPLTLGARSAALQSGASLVAGVATQAC